MYVTLLVPDFMKFSIEVEKCPFKTLFFHEKKVFRRSRPGPHLDLESNPGSQSCFSDISWNDRWDQCSR